MGDVSSSKLLLYNCERLKVVAKCLIWLFFFGEITQIGIV